jgi:hypothetical protein
MSMLRKPGVAQRRPAARSRVVGVVSYGPDAKRVDMRVEPLTSEAGLVVGIETKCSMAPL